MPDDGQALDLILETRLDVLTQAGDEVKRVIKAIEDQQHRLSEVEEFLIPGGSLSGAEDNLLTHVGDAINRLEILLRDTSQAVAVRRSIQPERADAPRSESSHDKRLQEVLQAAQKAKAEIDTVGVARQVAYGSFQDVSRWSVAGAHRQLRAAVGDYQRLIDEIRNAKDPWVRYENEMPRRGHELVTRYLELVAGMAVREFGLHVNIMSDVEALIQQLLEPLPDEDKPHESQRSPLALMGSLGKRHVPLGYPEWNLWALPLVGRTAGELVVTSLEGDVDRRLRILCADLYAQYVLGPSYLHAAVFLEFDPSPVPASPEALPDALRAALMLEKLPELGGGAYRHVLEAVANRVRVEWARALRAVGGEEPTIDDASRKVVERFLDSLAREYPDMAYDVQYVEEHAANGRELAAAPKPGDENEDALPTLAMRELISAMWLARLESPDKARLIHERAKIVARRRRTAPLGRPSRTSQPKGSTWAL